MRKFLLVACSCLLFSAGVSQADEVSFGLAKDNAWNSDEHIARMQSHGLTGHATIYYKLMSAANQQHPYDWVQHKYLDAGLPVVMTLIIDNGTDSTVGTSEGTDVSAGVPGLLSQVVSGVFDAPLYELADEIRKDGRPVTLQPFHEVDGGWYPWGMYAKGNNCQLAGDAIEHVIDVFNSAGVTNVSWEINVNRRDGKAQVFGEAECLAPRLNDKIDAWSVSTYNRCGTSSRYDEERSFADDFAPIYERIAALSDLPINVAEVSTSGMCAEKLPWFKEMLADLQSRFPRTKRVSYFFGTVPVGKASNTVPIVWGFGDDATARDAFRVLMQGEEKAAVEPPVQSQSASVPVKPRQAVTAAPVETVPDSPSGGQGPFSFDRAPWSVWSRLSIPMIEEGNPAQNSVTGESFGKTGPVLRFVATQRFLWDEGSFEHGPGLTLSGALSGNDNQWWNNQLAAGVTYGLYGSFDNGGSISWGGWSAEIFAGHKEYFAPVPARLSGGEGTVEFRFGINIGGDWLR